MHRGWFVIWIVWLTLFVSCEQGANEYVKLETDTFEITIDNSGNFSRITDISTGKSYLAEDIVSPLIQVSVKGSVLRPKRLNQEGKLFRIEFDHDLLIDLELTEYPTHLRFEVIACNRIDEIEWLAWGPYATTLNERIGETVGVVQGSSFAIGLQALNAKTLGGYPWYDNDTTPQLDIFEQDDYSDLNEEGKRETLYRVEAAKPELFGSTLQAYVRNRSEKRIVSNLDHDFYVSPVYEDGGIIGSKIALFGVSKEASLETIGKIEITESLPHPQIDGQWGKTAKGAAAAYLIYDFSEATIDKAIALTKEAGLKYLYHSDPFENWGHFELKKTSFPNGWDGLKACVEKAEASGIYVGVHTLSNFITTNDPLVTPKPDPRLGSVGTSILSEAIDATQTEIPIDEASFFAQYKNNNLKTVRIGDELIRYNSVSNEMPYRLLDCERGAWATNAGSHASGETVFKLTDHPYNVFLTNPELSIEMAKRLSNLYNYTGIRQISFDGLEGNRSTGMGNYGELLFTQTWYSNLSEEIKSQLIIDASRTTHFFWHTYSRMNWGEPWYAGFRESQTEYRLKNQAYFERNLMPNMLGWFSLRPDTTIEDIEWMLTRSAAYDAGFAFVVREQVLQQNGQTETIFKRIGDWEKLRMENAFSAEQKERMKGTETEFELVLQDEEIIGIRQVHALRFNHEPKVRQPGEPLYTRFEFENPTEQSLLNFILTAQNAEVSDIVLELDNSKTIRFDVHLLKGDAIRFTKDGYAEVVDHYLRLKQKIDLEALKLEGGIHTLDIDASFKKAEENAALKVELRLQDKVERISPTN